MEFQKLLEEVLTMVSVSLEGENCHTIFAYSGKCDPEAESVGERIMETRLRRALGDDPG